MNDDPDLRSGVARHLLLHMSRNGNYGSQGQQLLVLDHADGSYLAAADGHRYLDGLSGLYCAQLGYGYADEFADSARDQLSRLGYGTIWSAAHSTVVDLADRIAGLAPGDLNQVFFTSGGAESVESAWKLVRQYHVWRGEPQRTKGIARQGAYHGLTLGALAFTEDPALKDMFGPPVIPVRHVSNTNGFRRHAQGGEAEFTAELLGELESAILDEGPETVAMIILEPVQNRGGCITPPVGYWKGVHDIAHRYGILVVADEVITGFGRLGEWFASERYGATPDLLTVAKGLTAGYAPMGAVLVSDSVGDVLRTPGTVLNHGFTFAGHPLSAAIALTAIEIAERDQVHANVRDQQQRLADRLGELRGLDIVGDVRGDGFFWAVELVPGDPTRAFTEQQRQRLIRNLIPRKLKESGLLARVYDRSEPLVQIAPHLVRTRAQLDEITDIISDALGEASGQL